jgi:hypothetical protein
MKKGKQEASSTSTPEQSSPPPPPAAVDTRAESDAEVVQDVPPRPKVVSAKPLDASKVFDADVSDASNAKRGERPPDAEPGAAPERKKRRAKKGDEDDAPPEVTDVHLTKARNYVRTADSLHRAGLRHRYADVLDPNSLADLDRRMTLAPEQVDLMANPLAEGLARHGAALPWYVELGIGAFGIAIARANACKSVEAEYQRRAKEKAKS